MRYGMMTEEAVNADMDELVALARKADELEAERCRSEERLRLALRASGMGAWDWDIEHGTMVWDDRMVELFDANGNFNGDFNSFFNLIVPEDQPWVRRAIDHALGNERCFHVRTRVRRKDSSTALIQMKGYGYTDEQGKPTRMLGVCWLADDCTTPGCVDGNCGATDFPCECGRENERG